MTRQHPARPSRAVVRKTATVVGPRLDARSRKLRAWLTRGLTVFIFHDVTDAPSEFQVAGRSYTSLAVFERQVDWITSRFTLIMPTDLPQFGGDGALPPNGALMTFDDAWAGTYRNALPLLWRRGIGSLCFLNMGTVEGDLDLAAVRRYERARLPPEERILDRPQDAESRDATLAEVARRYSPDERLRRYQGEVAGVGDLEAAVASGLTWFASHLFHHWDLRTIAPSLFRESYRYNEAALARYANRLPAFSTTHGYAGGDGFDPIALARAEGARVIFTGTGNQNVDPAGEVLDRLSFEPEPSDESEWWYSTHRRRVLGDRTS